MRLRVRRCTRVSWGRAVRGTHRRRGLRVRPREFRREKFSRRADRGCPSRSAAKTKDCPRRAGGGRLRPQRRAAAHRCSLSLLRSLRRLQRCRGPRSRTSRYAVCSEACRRTLRSSSKRTSQCPRAHRLRRPNRSPRARRTARHRNPQRRSRSMTSNSNTRIVRASAIAIEREVAMMSALCDLRSLERDGQHRRTRSIE